MRIIIIVAWSNYDVDFDIREVGANLMRKMRLKKKREGGFGCEDGFPEVGETADLIVI
mgnify:FL=1